MAKEGLLGTLAVILHADVAGSTALVQKNEHVAHDRIQSAFRRLGDAIAKYRGHVLELRGDALLARFERASDAVTAALAFQAEHAEYTAQLNDDIQPMVRVGIALGEVVIADNTVTGAGVVLAQRIEQLAKPGGLCITGAIHEALPQRMPFNQENLGEQALKGFDESVRVYRVVLDPGKLIPPAQEIDQPEVPLKSRKLIAVAIAFILVIAGGMAYWYMPWEVREEPASVERMLFPLPDKPSIAVLPFINMSDDSQQEYFTDGMTEDLITDLSKISGLFVIARNSSFSYKGQQVKVRQVAEELGVRYVLEGSVRRTGDQVRINAQLIDASTGGHLWAERYDGTLENVFTLQDDVTRRIVAALAVELTGEEVAQKDRRDTIDTAAYDAFLQGWAYYILGTHADIARAKLFFEEAIRLDPGYARAQAALATIYWDAYINDWTIELGIPSFEAEEAWEQHLELAMEAPNSLAHILQSRIMVWHERYQEAVVEARKAVTLSGNDAAALAGLGEALVLVQRPDEGLGYIQEAMRLDPYHPSSYLVTLGAARFGMGNYGEATATFERAVKRNPDNELARIYLAASYAHLGRIDDGEAMIEAANYLRATRGRGALSLKSASVESLTFRDRIDFRVFGEKALQERVRSGLSRIPALSWQYLVSGVGAGPDQHQVKGATGIDTATAKMLHDRGVVFIDTSNESEWKNGRIPGAINLPYYLDGTDPTKTRYRQTTLSMIVGSTDEFVLFDCEQDCWCNSSFEAAKAVAWGFQKVYWYNSGVCGWREAGYPIEKSE